MLQGSVLSDSMAGVRAFRGVSPHDLHRRGASARDHRVLVYNKCLIVFRHCKNTNTLNHPLIILSKPLSHLRHPTSQQPPSALHRPPSSTTVAEAGAEAHQACRVQGPRSAEKKEAPLLRTLPVFLLRGFSQPPKALMPLKALRALGGGWPGD
jgi:hypothetical protein